jgi:hypothetical protein
MNGQDYIEQTPHHGQEYGDGNNNFKIDPLKHAGMDHRSGENSAQRSLATKVQSQHRILGKTLLGKREHLDETLFDLARLGINANKIQLMEDVGVGKNIFKIHWPPDDGQQPGYEAFIHIHLSSKGKYSLGPLDAEIVGEEGQPSRQIRFPDALPLIHLHHMLTSEVIPREERKLTWLYRDNLHAPVRELKSDELDKYREIVDQKMRLVPFHPSSGAYAAEAAADSFLHGKDHYCNIYHDGKKSGAVLSWDEAAKQISAYQLNWGSPAKEIKLQAIIKGSDKVKIRNSSGLKI